MSFPSPRSCAGHQQVVLLRERGESVTDVDKMRLAQGARPSPHRQAPQVPRVPLPLPPGVVMPALPVQPAIPIYDPAAYVDAGQDAMAVETDAYVLCWLQRSVRCCSSLQTHCCSLQCLDQPLNTCIASLLLSLRAGMKSPARSPLLC